MKYRFLRISTNLEEYPLAKEDTEEFPYLTKYVEDEEEFFIMDEESNIWEASKFFYMVDIKEFKTITEKEN